MDISHVASVLPVLALTLGLSGQPAQIPTQAPAELPVQTVSIPKVISTVQYSLTNRYPTPSVNQVFTDNILLTLAYMTGEVKKGDKIAWDKIRSPREFSFELNPQQTFAFHDEVLKKYEQTLALTTNAHFNFNEGFKSDGWLVGDGVCHLASFMNVAAQAAGLQVEAPTNHNFASIAQVEKEFGTSIYFSPTDSNTSSRQNLYITNTLDKKVAFVFTYDQNALAIKVEERS